MISVDVNERGTMLEILMLYKDIGSTLLAPSRALKHETDLQAVDTCVHVTFGATSRVNEQKIEFVLAMMRESHENIAGLFGVIADA